MSHSDTLAVCSVRYALGRTSYVVVDVIQAVKAMDELSEGTAVVLARDVARELREGRAGMECDVRAWEGFLDHLTARWPAALEEIRIDTLHFPGIGGRAMSGDPLMAYWSSRYDESLEREKALEATVDAERKRAERSEARVDAVRSALKERARLTVAARLMGASSPDGHIARGIDRYAIATISDALADDDQPRAAQGEGT